MIVKLIYKIFLFVSLCFIFNVFVSVMLPQRLVFNFPSRKGEQSPPGGTGTTAAWPKSLATSSSLVSRVVHPKIMGECGGGGMSNPSGPITS